MTCIKRKTLFRLKLRATAAVGAIALTAAFCAAPTRAADYVWPVTRVIDGDTVVVDASANLPRELSRLAVRLRGVDTPEKNWRAKCLSEEKAGRAAKAFTEMQVANAKRIVVRDPAWGKYGGRVIADLVLDEKSLADVLIAAGHGRAYDGKKRKSWCPVSVK